jgi:SAM-dependent methyltransferase
MQGLERGRVLDVPTGQGALSEDLEKLEFIVFSGDIERENILYRNRRCVQLDLNQGLPFKSGTFDSVVCVEGIEHLENPHALIREFARLVKRGGSLILTTPNVMSLKSRLRFLLCSYLDFFRYFGPLPKEERHRYEEHEQQHLNPLFYGELKFILEKYGFGISRIETNRVVKKWGVFYPFLRWVVKRKTQKKFRGDPFLTSDVLLDGEILIFVAKR